MDDGLEVVAHLQRAVLHGDSVAASPDDQRRRLHDLECLRQPPEPERGIQLMCPPRIECSLPTRACGRACDAPRFGVWISDAKTPVLPCVCRRRRARCAQPLLLLAHAAVRATPGIFLRASRQIWLILSFWGCEVLFWSSAFAARLLYEPCEGVVTIMLDRTSF